MRMMSVGNGPSMNFGGASSLGQALAGAVGGPSPLQMLQIDAFKQRMESERLKQELTGAHKNYYDSQTTSKNLENDRYVSATRALKDTGASLGERNAGLVSPPALVEATAPKGSFGSYGPQPGVMNKTPEQFKAEQDLMRNSGLATTLMSTNSNDLNTGLNKSMAAPMIVYGDPDAQHRGALLSGNPMERSQIGSAGDTLGQDQQIKIDAEKAKAEEQAKADVAAQSTPATTIDPKDIPPGVDPKEYAKKYSAQMAKNSESLLKKAQGADAAIKQEVEYYDLLRKLDSMGGLGPLASSGVARGVTNLIPSWAPGEGLRDREALMKQIDAMKAQIQLSHGKDLPGQVSNYEDVLMGKPIPGMDINDPAVALRMMEDRIRTLQDTQAKGAAANPGTYKVPELDPLSEARLAVARGANPVDIAAEAAKHGITINPLDL